MSDRKLPKPPEQILREEGLMDEDALAAAREETITVLSECFARDVLTVEDFERRAELVHGARTIADLGTAIDGIRTGGLPARAGPSAQGATGTTQSPTISALQRATPDLPASRVKPYDRAIAVFAETRRVGRWIPARQNTAVAVMGSTVIDLREALLGPGRTSVTALALMGSVEVIVPPGIHVECSGSAIFGSFDQQREFTDATGVMDLPSDSDAPILSIDGFAMFGSVEVIRRHVGESRRQARRRRRLEKRERRRLERRERRRLRSGR